MKENQKCSERLWNSLQNLSLLASVHQKRKPLSVKKMEMDYHEPINMSMFSMHYGEGDFGLFCHDGFVLVHFRIKLISKMRENKNSVKKTVNCRDYENNGHNK